MTVKELIHQLEHYEPNLPVQIVCDSKFHETTQHVDVKYVYYWIEDKSIQLSE
jgi:hypothetical protein